MNSPLVDMIMRHLEGYAVNFRLYDYGSDKARVRVGVVKDGVEVWFCYFVECKDYLINTIIKGKEKTWI